MSVRGGSQGVAEQKDQAKVPEEQAPPSRDVMELLTLCGLLEGHAAELAVSFIADDDFERLSEIADTIARYNYQKGVQAIRELDIRFHDIIVQRSGQSLLLELWTILNNRMAVLNALSRDVLKVDGADSARRHHEYIQELRSKDPQRARAAAREHYQDYVRRLQAVIAERTAVHGS